MRLTVLKIGRISYPEIRALAAMYEERLGPFAKVDAIEVKDEAAALKLLKRPLAEHPLIALDERGKVFSSPELAETLRRMTDDPAVKSVTFLIGGPMGLSEGLRRDARITWSLSKATFTSDMAWLLVWEQIYRAYNILKGTGYHHE